MSTDRSTLTRTVADAEDGIALIAALFAVLVLSGMAVIFVATATFESRSTSSARDYESAIHVSEAAVHALVPKLNEDPDGHVTEDAGGNPHIYDLGPEATEADEREWALAIAEDETMTPDSMLVPMAGGEGVAIRPRDTAGPMNVIYSVGWVPSRDAPVRRRVLKLRFDALRFKPEFGLFTGGPLHLAGDASITGDFGNVHTNEGATSSGSSFVVEGNLTATGSLTADCNRVQGSCVGGTARQPTPHISARQIYALNEQAAGPWFDLCPPGGTTPATMRAWSSGGPCTGTILWTNGVGPKSFQGWEYRTTGPDGPRWRGTHVHRGVYYVRGNADLGPMEELRAVTVIAEEQIGDGGRNSGHIRVTGSAQVTSALSGLTLIADRDIELVGDAFIEGLVAANEQISATGSSEVIGAVLAQEEKDTLNSRVQESTVSGEMVIHYDEELEVPLTGVIRITAWNEL